MLFAYKALDTEGGKREGSIDAVNVDAAISSLQRRGYVVTSINAFAEKTSFLQIKFTFLERVSNKEVVIFSRQIATLFEAQVSALRVFRLLASESDNLYAQRVFTEIADDVQGGSSISKAFEKHPDVFSSFYINMVRAGEESGKLVDIFLQLADHLDRTYEVTTKARNALTYPIFVVVTFFVVMGLMLTLVIPRISDIILDSGQEIPIYTKIVIGLSQFASQYIGLILLFMGIAGVFLWRFSRTNLGARAFDEFKLTVPYVGTLYQKLYLSRIADSFSTMLSSGLPMIQTLEITAEVVNNRLYREILEHVITDVKGGRSISDAFSEYPEIPGVMTQMVKVGEESGSLASILGTMAKFYRREVNNAVDNLINLIEPAMIVMLGLGVGVLLAAVLMPIYNIATGI
jgi:type IV pilus assembly protein PilC